MNDFFQKKVELSLEIERLKQKYDNPRHNVLELYNALVQIQFTTSKTKLEIYNNKICMQVEKYLKNLKFAWGKSTAQSLLEKSNFCKTVKKKKKKKKN